MTKKKAIKIKIRTHRPTGYRVLGKEIKRTKKAVLFDYYGWELWIPRASLVQIPDGVFTAPQWAIESAKDYKTEMLE